MWWLQRNVHHYHPMKSHLCYIIWNKYLLLPQIYNLAEIYCKHFLKCDALQTHWKEEHLGLSQNFHYLPFAVCCMIPMFANVSISNKIIRSSFTRLIPINPSILLHVKLLLQFTTKSNYINLSLLPLFLTVWGLMYYIPWSSGKIFLTVGMLGVEWSVSQCKHLYIVNEVSV